MITSSTQPDQTSPCHDKKIPLWLVFLDNIPTLVLFILGALLIAYISVVGALLFFCYALFSVFWFWAKICPYCHHYGTQACPCGYGTVSAKLFRRRTDRSFKKVFTRNLPIVFPNWFIPPAFALYLLLTEYTPEIMVISVAFCLTGFIVIPLISKFVGCKNCEIREDCPWMKMSKKSGN